MILVIHMRRGLASTNLPVARAKTTEGRRMKVLNRRKTRIKTTTVKKANLQKRRNLRADFQCSRMRWHIFKAGSFIRERHCFIRTRFCNLGRSAQTASSSQSLCLGCALFIFCRTSPLTLSDHSLS